ncbi:hypothetical protein KEM48_006945 [Puccinia striiformis f. sp. tritici PST-130]|nr:hypothetical protein KEM48_006945 [Puccinia striiformis f. sp. tritici PST-130]
MPTQKVDYFYPALDHSSASALSLHGLTQRNLVHFKRLDQPPTAPAPAVPSSVLQPNDLTPPPLPVKGATPKPGSPVDPKGATPAKKEDAPP